MSFKQHVSLWTLFMAVSHPAVFAGYHLERISPVLNQPTYITQAPGDPANIIYYTTRIDGLSGEYFATNPTGKVWRYDLNTRISTPVLSLSSRNAINDTGLQSIAFHPDFNNAGTAGYGKLYVASSQAGTVALNRVEEFPLLNPDGTFKTGSEVFAAARLILRYDNNNYNNHAVNWIGFDPTAVGVARDYLYVSTGDGAFERSYNNGSGTAGRPSQNPADLKGKLLRLDISGIDSYPADANKNFSIPPSNPFPGYNAAHPGSPVSGLGEIFLTGLRNGYRVSFDRANGDIYWGDVGENAYEEVHFVKAGGSPATLPADFGWPQLEGVHPSTVNGAPHTSTNPFTGVSSRSPIREYPHTVGRSAIGGYVYRGPIPELRGKYFYADFVAGKIWMLGFDRETDPAAFNGANGDLTDMTSALNAGLIDRSDPSYVGDNSLATVAGLDHPVSYGEDNRGNLYIVDFCYGTGFSGQYGVNGGELFMLVPDEAPPDLVWQRTGDQLRFSWIGTGKLQTQANGLLSTHWTDYPGGTFSPVNVPIDSGRGSVFFRLSKDP